MTAVDHIKNAIYKSSVLRNLASPAIKIRRRMLGGRRNHSSEYLANLRRLVVGDVLLRVDEFNAEFWVNAESDLFRRIVVSGRYEPELFNLAKDSINGDRDVLDVGANIGLYTVGLAKLLQHGKVLSLEPSTFAANRLKKNIEHNGVRDKTIVFQGAASKSGGAFQLNYVEGREEYSSLGKLVHPSIQGAKQVTEDVRISTVDQLVSEHSLRPAFMKVDVEGFEHNVFSGAVETLREFKPIILSELSDPLLKSNGSSSAAVVKSLREMGYKVTDVAHPSVEPGARPFCDIICRPP